MLEDDGCRLTVVWSFAVLVVVSASFAPAVWFYLHDAMGKAIFWLIAGVLLAVVGVRLLNFVTDLLT